MKIINTLFLAGIILLANTTFATSNTVVNIEEHAHDVNFSVIVKNGEQLLNGAKIQVFISAIQVADGISDENGKANLLVKSYKHQKVTIITTYSGMITDSMKNISLSAGKFYYANLNPSVTKETNLVVAKANVTEKRKETEKQEVMQLASELDGNVELAIKHIAMQRRDKANQ